MTESGPTSLEYRRVVDRDPHAPSLVLADPVPGYGDQIRKKRLVPLPVDQVVEGFAAALLLGGRACGRVAEGDGVMTGATLG